MLKAVFTPFVTWNTVMTIPGVNQPHDSARVFPSRYFPCFLLVLLSLAFSVGQAEVNPTNAQIAAALGSGKSGATLSNYGRKYSNSILRGVTLKDVYRFNDLLTTPYGPAYADIQTEDSNFLSCRPPQGRPFTFALCFFSGPAYPTGDNPSNPALPCKLNADGTVANCTCYAISSDSTSPKMPYYVDIHAISNLYIYQKTIETCGLDGAKCSQGEKDPAVCDAINTNLLVPGADMVSVYSPMFTTDYDTQNQSSTTSCTGQNQGLYAGCMTAPCYKTGQFDSNGNELVECKCPVYSGPFQIGQGGQNCNANQPPPGNTTQTKPAKGKYVWSAAYNTGGGSPTPPATPCIPDSGGSNGCPLYDPSKDYSQIISPDSALCKNVCKSYGQSTQNKGNGQSAYTCDSTLCTTVGIGQSNNPNYNPSSKTQTSLIGAACNGLSNSSGLQPIMLVESLAGCSCCASQVCGCDTATTATNQEIYELNQKQTEDGILTQCQINGTLCGTKP